MSVRSEKAAPFRPMMPRAPATMASLRSSPAPRLAATGHRSSPSSTVSVVTPRLAKRRQEDEHTPRTPVEATPIRTADLNVTPRSSARRQRVSSVNTTPTQPGAEVNGTLSPANPARRPGARFASPRSPGSDRRDSDTKRRIAATTTYPPPGRPVLSPTMSSASRLSRTSEQNSAFFFAEDGPPKEAPPRPPLHQKTSSFFYANGRRETGAVTLETAQAMEDVQKFEGFTQPSRSPQPANGANAPYVFGAQAPTSRQNTFVIASDNGPASPGGFAAIATRSPSPTKFDFHLSYRKGASQVIRPPLSTTASASSLSSPDSKRRVSSLDTVSELQRDDRRSSTTSVDSGAAKQLSPAVTRPTHTRQPSLSVPLSPVNSNLPTSPIPTVSSPLSTTAAAPHSSAPPARTADLPTTDTTSLTRQERKVLDLEISNSSLLAINRTLEREVRKQKSELRHLRRVTRSTARTSWLSDGSINGLSSLDELAADSGAGAGVYGLLNVTGASQRLSDDEDDDGPSEVASTLSNPLSASDGPRSPASVAADHKRLRLDLARHRELLVDSQRMNVSLKRCLGVTEMLIREGARAVEYRVEVGDLRLGGRVLSPEEVDGDGDGEGEGEGEGDASGVLAPSTVGDTVDLDPLTDSDYAMPQESYVGTTDEEMASLGPDSAQRFEAQAFEYFDEESVRRSQAGTASEWQESSSPQSTWMGLEDMMQTMSLRDPVAMI